MSQKKARQKRQELRVQGIDTNKPVKVPNRMHPTALKWFLEEQERLRAEEAKPKRVRKTRSQQLAESMANHPAGKAKNA